MENGLGFMGVFVAVLMFLWGVLTFCIPFMIYSLLGKMDKLIAAQKETNRINNVISQNVYSYITRDR